jgi:hypothetical protein
VRYHRELARAVPNLMAMRACRLLVWRPAHASEGGAAKKGAIVSRPSRLVGPRPAPGRQGSGRRTRQRCFQIAAKTLRSRSPAPARSSGSPADDRWSVAGAEWGWPHSSGPSLAQAGEIGSFEQGDDLRHPHHPRDFRRAMLAKPPSSSANSRRCRPRLLCSDAGSLVGGRGFRKCARARLCEAPRWDVPMPTTLSPEPAFRTLAIIRTSPRSRASSCPESLPLPCLPPEGAEFS